MSTVDTNAPMEPNAPMAFALVCGAGAATGLGAAVVFFPRLVALTSERVLAGSLGIASGVMIYVSFAEILVKSQFAFFDAGFDEDAAFNMATLSFFAGVFVMMVLDAIVHRLSGEKQTLDAALASSGATHPARAEVLTYPGCADNPGEDLRAWRERAAEEVENEEVTTMDSRPSRESKILDCAQPSLPVKGGATSKPKAEEETASKAEEGSALDLKTNSLTVVDDTERQRLQSMGLKTALAIGLHNFPEGLATFVATLNEPRVGAVLAIAIGIHNIPEGLCVALPIYYATGDRRKAFLWACLSGVSEPVAAALGWWVLAGRFGDKTYAWMFGLVAGMMVTICAKELLPTAHRYDKGDTVVTYSFIVGMAIMAASLVLFRV
mmetsp:Transcript_40312/g.78842  ORF Transcript_40312/g.78842 Transcript_40312/m.78842 type:complete len:380 (-) Transcript_40312:174-1313(-)|eukprot:CAMPEP_0194324060 /NCGR_PEP_ID=MMETSP0171-20130528/26236_1 /TAXON_ID=218684 /ORGANISM="Corethron pennatum, Strain L29A3" /LENGTH=379 /DNA_ID=CAMNT_0039082853 /DNA_START=91 /DNA_END=1230 /DNA_ORIENTATION=+